MGMRAVKIFSIRIIPLKHETTALREFHSFMDRLSLCLTVKLNPIKKPDEYPGELPRVFHNSTKRRTGES
jgi:hypothetical protein